MRNIYSFDVHEDNMPRGTPLPLWGNHPKDPSYGLMPPGSRDPGFRSSQGLGTGFPLGMPRPMITFHRRLGTTPPADIYMASRDTFTVSDRAKELFERLDPAAFEFVEADTLLADGSAGPKHWVMDIVRTVNAIDDTRPGADIWAPGIAAYKTTEPNVFREDRLGGVRVFRLPGGYTKLCDGEFKRMFEDAGLIATAFTFEGHTQ
jgi:hypothetical protein